MNAPQVRISGNILLFPSRTIGHHDNIFEGEVQSSVYVRPCVIKFATISEQNVREAEILSKLESHTNVIAVIQSGIYRDFFEDRVFIALDKCYRDNLRQYLANKKAAEVDFDLLQAIDFAKQIIDGVTHIHEKNIIHLDLKPSNILISQNLRLIKIADFGLSIVVKSRTSKVLHKSQFGTNGYRPTESFGNGTVSQRTDIFSVGAVLFHLLTNGEDVFGSDQHAFVRNVMNDTTEISGLLVNNADAAIHLIKCMVSKERCRRPSIWEVSDHPYWAGEEVNCQLEYFANDEKYDTDENESEQEDVTETAEHEEQNIEFLRRMKRLGYNRKPKIVLFYNENLYIFDPQNASITRLHKHHGGTNDLRFSAVTAGEYIYDFIRDHSASRLEYGDVTATWEKRSNWIGDHGHRPPVVGSSYAIFLVGAWWQAKANRSVSMYDVPSDKWRSLDDKPTASYGSALVCNEDFLYCIGGLDEKFKPMNIVERMNLRTLEWTRMNNMNQTPNVLSAAEYDRCIYVVGGHGSERRISIQIFNPLTDQWDAVKSIKDSYFGGNFKVFEIDGHLFVVGATDIKTYNIIGNQWSIALTYPKNDMRVIESVLVRMST